MIMFVKLVLTMLTQVYEKFIQLESGFPFQGNQNVGGEQKSEYRVQVVCAPHEYAFESHLLFCMLCSRLPPIWPWFCVVG